MKLTPKKLLRCAVYICIAGAVVEVKSNLESAQRDPDTLAQGLANACDTAVRFARSMRRILVGMRDI